MSDELKEELTKFGNTMETLRNTVETLNDNMEKLNNTVKDPYLPPGTALEVPYRFQTVKPSE